MSRRKAASSQGHSRDEEEEEEEDAPTALLLLPFPPSTPRAPYFWLVAPVARSVPPLGAGRGAGPRSPSPCETEGARLQRCHHQAPGSFIERKKKKKEVKTLKKGAIARSSAVFFPLPRAPEGSMRRGKAGRAQPGPGSRNTQVTDEPAVADRMLERHGARLMRKKIRCSFQSPAPFMSGLQAAVIESDGNWALQLCL